MCPIVVVVRVVGTPCHHYTCIIGFLLILVVSPNSNLASMALKTKHTAFHLAMSLNTRYVAYHLAW